MTKIVSTMAVMQLVDRCLLELDQPAELVPAIAEAMYHGNQRRSRFATPEPTSGLRNPVPVGWVHREAPPPDGDRFAHPPTRLPASPSNLALGRPFADSDGLDRDAYDDNGRAPTDAATLQEPQPRYS